MAEEAGGSSPLGHPKIQKSDSLCLPSDASKNCEDELLDILNMRHFAYTPKDFQWTRWGPGDIERIARTALDAKRDAYKKIKAVPETERTFENTIAAIEASGDEVGVFLNRIGFLMNVSPDAGVREAAKSALDRLNKEIVDIEYDEEIYRAVKTYAAKGEALEGSDAKLFRDTMRAYWRMGFEIDPALRAELKDNIKEINRLSIDFSQNINNYRDAIAVSREELEGLPESYIAGLKRDAEGMYLVGLDYPEVRPFLKNAISAERRKELNKKNLRKGGSKNIDLLREILKLRQKNARMLGYAHHADYALEIQMAKDGRTVFEFLQSLASRLRSGVERDINELRLLKREATNDPDAKLEHHDLSFYENGHKKRLFSVDDEKVREYFPLERVKAGMFSIYSRLFAITFEKLSGYPLYHEDAELYAIRDAGGDIIAYFILDLHPREGKYGHAGVFPIISGRRIAASSGDGYISPLVAMAANFPKPRPEHPSLLSHREVETFFHEFGHVMHGTLTTAPYASQSGTSVARDFVESPSQMLEHWIWESETIRMMSKHFRTGEKIPENILGSLIKAKYHMSAFFYIRQIVFALFDYRLHTEEAPDPLRVFNEIHQELIGVPMPKENLWPAGFRHLIGYDAGYYSYLWSKVYSSDMFTRFKQEGLLNPDMGRDWREWILEKGSSMEEIDLMRGFLGREPNNEAFLKEIGL